MRTRFLNKSFHKLAIYKSSSSWHGIKDWFDTIQG